MLQNTDGTGAPPQKQQTAKSSSSSRKFDESKVTRQKSGGPGGGQFAPKGAGGGGGSRPGPTNANPVGMGERGGRVRDLQARLNAMGAHLKVDGQFGPATLAAVRALQRRYGLKVDGLVGPKTTAALRGQAEGRRKQSNLKRIATRKTSAATTKRQKAEMTVTGKPSTAAPAAYGHG